MTPLTTTLNRILPRPCKLPGRPGSNPRTLKTISLYAAIMLLGTTLFFTLHHLGNGIPYDQARQRFAHEYAAHQTESHANRYFRGERPLFDFEFCQLSLVVMAGARSDPPDNPLVNAIRLRAFRKKINPSGNYCAEAQAAANGAELAEGSVKYRYWWGSKAALAILLRFLSVYDIHLMILFATYLAWALLASSLLLLSWRILLTAAPLILLGALFSGVYYFADIANGLPYLFTLLAASALALLLLRPQTARWAPLSCFITGMASAYLWFADGHTALALVLIGLIAWLGYTRLQQSAPIRRAAACLALYLAAFAICIALGQAVKIAVVEWATPYPGWDLARSFFDSVSYRLDQTGAETIAGLTADETARIVSCVGCGDPGWQQLPIIRDLRGFWILNPFGIPAGNLLTAYSALALTAAIAIAIRQAKRGQPELSRSLLWLGALALLASIQFFLPSDIPFRNARFAFLLLATCWIALALAIPQMERRALTTTAATAAAAIAAALGLTTYWHIDANQVIAQGAAGNPPVISSNFNVYHRNGQLTYIKENCHRTDTSPRFFLHPIPQNPADLPPDRQGYSFDNLDFNFADHQRWVPGKCVATVNLPDYDIMFISTGQYIYDAGIVWGSNFPLNLTKAALESARATVTNETPLARNIFDLYRQGSQLIYAKQNCRPADTQPRFYLHLTPQNPHDLPPSRRQYGFDNRDFNFAHQGGIFNGQCLAAINLPDYPIATIQTGQHTPAAGRLWTSNFPPSDTESILASRRAQYAAATNNTPLTRNTFDLYRQGNQLTYIKENCQPTDTQPRFYLHLTPQNPHDLPPDRQEHGFDNLDFSFANQGALFDGKCLAAINLPNYNITTIQTGQFTPNGDRIWQAEIPYR